ncbi:hypothetical protein E8E15_003217 [Penicillium rubens]|jgi:hypothetical protein|uniref:Uncharacterized protein n=1 Tax=Penicillium chrysogenum TaxID=5076 RepID=A0ABQ8WFM1_PENCH|nr:hypothetical protein E8E15_003217 [Penicillium rubens]KAJ5264958.1 hypothetical protein N7505_007751 [Penicillium chrysogenum]
MPAAILPSSAAAHTPQVPPIVVLKDNVPWLKQTFERVKQAGRPLNNLKQQTSYLIDILTPKSAIWALCSVMLENTLGLIHIESCCSVMSKRRLWMIHIEAYVVYVDMVSESEVAFKLTEETINGIMKFYKEFQMLDAATYRLKWPQKQAELDKLHDEFSEAINRFVYRTDAKALEGLEKDGSGELLGGCSVDVKAAILNLFVPLTPPPHVVHFLYPVAPCLDGTEPGVQRPIHLFEENQPWSTQPDVRTSNTRNHSSLGDGLDNMYAATFPVASVGSRLYTTTPVSAVEPIPHTPMYSSNAAADAGAFGGSSFFLC